MARDDAAAEEPSRPAKRRRGLNDEQEGGDTVLLRAQTDDIKTVLALLEALPSSRAATHAWAEVSPKGLTISAMERSALYGSAHLAKVLFHEFDLVPDYDEHHPLEFGVHLGHLLLCLKTLSGERQRPDKPTTLQLSYRERSSTPCLALVLVEGATVTECEISALDVEPQPKDLYQIPTEACISARVVFSSDLLRNVLAMFDLDGVAKDKERTVRLLVKRTPPGLSLTVSSSDVGAEIAFPEPAVSKFDVSGDVDFSYGFALLSSALRALRDPSEALLRVSEHGRLHLMLKFQDFRGNNHFADYCTRLRLGLAASAPRHPCSMCVHAAHGARTRAPWRVSQFSTVATWRRTKTSSSRRINQLARRPQLGREDLSPVRPRPMTCAVGFSQ